MEIIKKFFKEEEGLATVEIVLILVILVGLVVLFRNAISSFFGQVIEKIKQGGSDILNDPTGSNG